MELEPGGALIGCNETGSCTSKAAAVFNVIIQPGGCPSASPKEHTIVAIGWKSNGGTKEFDGRASSASGLGSCSKEHSLKLKAPQSRDCGAEGYAATGTAPSDASI